jgi:hypothetical protein
MKSVLERNCGVELNNCRLNKEYTWNLSILVSLFFTQTELGVHKHGGHFEHLL